MLKALPKMVAKNKAKYSSIGRVWCPILNSFVHFTAEGRLHLIYKRNRKKRNEKEQIYKLSLFPFAIPVIKNSENIKNWRTSSLQNSDVQFYAITNICNAHKGKPINIRVIIKRTGDGQFNFHSIMEDK